MVLVLLLSACGEGGEGPAPPDTPAPMVTTDNATSVTISTAVLNGGVNPNGLATDAWFQWSTDANFTSFDNTPTQAMGNGTTNQPITVTLSGLGNGVTYYCRVAATSTAGDSIGQTITFTTNRLPAVTTDNATSVTISSAVLNGGVNPNGLATDAWFQWSTDAGFANYSNTPTQTMGFGTTNQPISAPLSGLGEGVTYYYRVAATNTAGDSIGQTITFTTNRLPAVTTDNATAITIGSAVLSGGVNPNGFPTTVQFEYGTDPSLSTRSTTPSQDAGSGFASLPFSVPISGLASYTTYYFRMVASSNAGGAQAGAIKSFPTGEFYVAVGDSITEGEGDNVISDGTGYEPILQNLLSASRGYPNTIANEGVGGVKSAYGAANISSTLSKYPSAKYFLVLYGTNDSDPAGPPVPSGLGLNPGNPGYNGSYKDNMQKIISAIKASGKLPYLAKVLFIPSDASRDTTIQKYNAVIEELVVANGISVTPPDFYTYFKNHQGELADGLHPNGVGYQSMANLWDIALP